MGTERSGSARVRRGRASKNTVEANDVGCDPHKRTLTVSVLDPRGGVLGTASFRVSGDGHRAMEAFVAGFGPVRRWGVEGATGLGRHTSMFLIRAGYDVRDVCPNRTAVEARKRRQGKSDALDSVRVAREVQADPDVPVAFKRGPGDSGPDEVMELLALWNNARRSLVKTRQHITNEAEALICALPEAVRDQLPDTYRIRVRLAALADVDRAGIDDAADVLRLHLLDGHLAQLVDLDEREIEAARELDRLTTVAGSTLSELCGIAARTDAELLVEIGDPRRFAGEGGFARFNGTAPLPASSAEGDEAPKRHRLNRGGNRQVNAMLHRMAVTQLRCEPRARALYDSARQRGHTKKEAMRILKRHLSNTVYRRMMSDLNRREDGPEEKSTSNAA